MLNTINSDLIRGHINTIILKALFEGDRYGYDIVKEIEEKSSGQYKLKQPTLYSCLKRLEVQGFIRSYWGAKSNGGRRKYYTLTDMGRELFIKNQTEWEYSRTVIDKLISDREYDLSKADHNNYDDESVEEEIPETFEEETPVSEPETDEPKTTEEQTEYLDTSSILSRLFESQNTDDSYSDKLFSSEYVAKERIGSDSYFKDYDTQTDYPETDDEEYETDETTEAPMQAEQMRMPVEETEPGPKDAATANNFISYRAKLDERDTDKQLLEREYKNVLGQLIGDDGSSPEPPADPAFIPYSSEETQYAEGKTEIAEESETETETTPVTPETNPKNVLDQGLNTISDAALRSMGDNVKTRVHNDEAAAAYNTQYHYYSNKLMLVHYGILFGIMILEVIFSFLLVRVGLKITSKYDLFTYIAGTLLSIAFPVTAAIKNFRDPTKTKRFEFDFKNAMRFRIWVTVCCLIIIYCANVFAGMPVTFSKEFLSGLLLPILFAIDFPISAVIFKILHGTGKFNQTY